MPGKPIEIFKRGTHTDINGNTISFTEEDVKATAGAYDPALYKAPLVVGHPKIEDAAYGWAESLSYSDDGVLRANPEDVDPAFAEMVNDKRFPRISASFFHPNSKSNPKPGVYYLRHIGFLGAAAPAVKGLKPASFSEAGDDCVTLEFAAPDNQLAITRVLTGLRDFLLETFGRSAADAVVPSWVAEEAVISANTPEETDDPATSYSDPEEPVMPKENENPEFAERESALTQREQELKDREERLAKQERDRRQEDVANFADGLVDQGRLLPAEKDGFVSFMAQLGEIDGQTVSFAEGDETVKKTPDAWFREFMAKLPERVDFSERGAGEREEDTVSYSAPTGYDVNPEKAKLHKQALEYAEKNSCDYVTAVNAVSR